MSSLKLWLLGPPRIEVDDRAVNISRHKGTALLAYLAVTGEVQRRDLLAALFWPESPQSRARASLRRDLSTLKTAPVGSWLHSERETVALSRTGFWLDVEQFRLHQAECEQHEHATDVVCAACLSPLAEAAGLYRDRFLSGFSIPGCPDFDEWQFFQAEALHQELAVILEKLVRGYSAQREEQLALPFARRWLAINPLHEPAHRQLMRLYSSTGQKAAALRQYQICSQLLQDELGVGPAAETTALYEAIRSKTPGQEPAPATVAPHAASPHISTAAIVRHHNLPVQATRFVGRVEGLAAISQRLRDPACRLLTLVGPGGIGKTRLAIQAAHNLLHDPLDQQVFKHGVQFVRLASVTSSGQLVTAIANALDFTFYRNVEPKAQLLSYLREKELLLVLDNFEYLLSPLPPGPGEKEPSAQAAQVEGCGGTEIVSAILTTAPAVKLMVTSREALKLQEEWIYPVAGMRYPASGVDDALQLSDLAGYSAVRLFAESALRVSPDFSLEANAACVIQICHLAEGVPLAIELAAAWLRHLPCAQIAAEIERSLDFLTTSLRDVPARHRSLRAVFEHSWRTLSAAEQEVLQALSVFRGGFQQVAAAQVARATLLDLMALAEKSLLKAMHNGRYRMHELVRQYAEEKLDENPQQKRNARDRHCRYFVGFLREREFALRGQRQRSALAEIASEIKNVQAAWDYLVVQKDIKALAMGLDSLFDFYWISSRFQEGADNFRQAAESLEGSGAPEIILVKLGIRQAGFYASLGALDLAKELLQQNLAAARRLDARGEIALSLDLLGNVVDLQGDNEAAVALFRESLAINREAGDRAGTAESFHNLGWIAIGRGDYREAKQLFVEGLALHEAIENRAGIAHVLDSLAMAGFLLGHYAEAEGQFRQSLGMADELGDRHGVARALSGLGLVAWAEGGSRLVQARELMEASLQVDRATGQRLEVGRRLAYLGAIANSQGDYDGAEAYSLEALAISREIGHAFGISWSLAGLGTAVCGQGNMQTAGDYLREAVANAFQARDIPLTLDTLVSWASYKIEESVSAAGAPAAPNGVATQQREQVGEILALAVEHPVAWQIVKDRAARLLDRLQVEDRQVNRTGASARSMARRVEALVTEVLGDD